MDGPPRTVRGYVAGRSHRWEGLWETQWEGLWEACPHRPHLSSSPTAETSWHHELSMNGPPHKRTWPHGSGAQAAAFMPP